MNKIILAILVLSVQMIQGCSTGDLRMWNDAMSGANGYEVTYPDQSDTDYIDDIRWTTGVRNGQGFQKIKNTGNDYCKVRIEFEDGTYDYFHLAPGESSGSTYMSIYNQAEYIQTLCHSSRRVFNESFDS